jgi:hypothetical protein
MMQLNLNRLSDDTTRMSELGREEFGVVCLDAVAQVGMRSAWLTCPEVQAG